MIKMSRTTISSDPQSEWDRISQNPDNVIVSDVLRDSLSEYYTDAPSKSQRAVVTLISESQNISVPIRLLRLEQAHRGWSLVCACSTQTAYTIMRLSREDWTKLDLKIGNDKIRDFIIDQSCFRIEVEMPAVQTTSAFECTVIASCVVEQTTFT